MVLWIAILLLGGLMACAVPGILSRLMTDPLRRPWERERQARAWQELELLGHGVARWRLSLEEGPAREAAGEPLLDWPVSGPRRAVRRPFLACWSIVPHRPLAPEAPLVLALHGFSDTSASLKELLVRLAHLGLPTVAVDLPGHGFSSGSHCTFGKREVPALRRLLEALERPGPLEEAITNVRRRPLVFVGSSYGGALAMRLLLELPAAARRRVAAIVAGAPYWDLRQTIQLYAGTVFSISNRRLIDYAMRCGEERHGFRIDEESPHRLMHAWRERNVEAAGRGEFPRLLLLRGTLDDLQDAELARRIGEAWPGPVDFRDLEGIDHITLMRREPTLDATEKWLRDQGLVPGGAAGNVSEVAALRGA